MTTTDQVASPSSSASEELQAALERLSKGIRDPEAARKSRERMDRMREENRKRFGIQEIAVDLIRESRFHS